MSKLLKVIVNTLLLLAILSAGALVIPPFAGITTLVSDGMGNTNISRGAVTYAKKTDTSSVATGDKILVDDNSGKYIYTIQSLDIAAGTASVKNVISGDTTEITVRATVSKVIITIPVIGFLSMAAQSREGIMIIGLAILFLVILFILSEVWKRDEEEDEEEEEEPRSTFSFFKKKEPEVEEESSNSKISQPFDNTITASREAKKRRFTSTGSKVVSMNGRGVEVYVIKPQDFAEAQTAADLLKEGRTVVINLEGVELTVAQRSIDFVGGATYAINGSLQAVSNNIFIAAPDSIEVSGDLKSEIMNENTISPQLK